MPQLSLERAQKWLFYALVLGAPFSLVPSISVERLGYAGLRIGLYQLLAALFVATYARDIFAFLRAAVRGRAGKVMVSGLTLSFIYSVYRSIVLPRAALMLGSVGLLIALAIAAYLHIREHSTTLTDLERPVLVAGLFFGLCTVLQLVVSTFTLTHTLLCIGCKPDVFGFPRANVFAVEPQFWANALLPFVLFAFISVVKRPSRVSVCALSFSLIGVGLTFSRGAFFALVPAFGFVITASIIRRVYRMKSLAIASGMAVLASLFAFGLLVASASIRYRSTDDIAYKTTKGMIEQLSLGSIILPGADSGQASADSSHQEDQFESQGFVTASQRDRAVPAQMAWKALKKSPVNAMLGVGLGNFAPYVRDNIAPVPLSLTVYIFYILVLVESGVLGLAMLVFVYMKALFGLHRSPAHEALTVASILVAFLAQYVFFGSYVNVVYIWLWLGVALGLGTHSAARQK